MKSQVIVTTASLLLLAGIFAHMTPAAFANPCSSTTINVEKEKKDGYASMGFGEKKENSNGNNCNGGNGGYGGYGGNGAYGGKGGYGGDAANSGDTGNTAAASSSHTHGSGDIKSIGGDANGGRGGDGGNANGGYGGSVFVCNDLGKYGVNCS